MSASGQVRDITTVGHLSGHLLIKLLKLTLTLHFPATGLELDVLKLFFERVALLNSVAFNCVELIRDILGGGLVVREDK